MPLSKDPQGGGTNADGSKTYKFCSYCYENGNFKFNGSVTEFQEHCRAEMIKGGHSRFTAWLFSHGLKRLERWK
jgi:hypothetical protein